MRILFDNTMPRGLMRWLKPHTVTEARSMGWDRLSNGELIRAAESAGFELIVTNDKNIRYQQNLRERNIAILVLSVGRWSIIKDSIELIVGAVNSARPGDYAEIEFLCRR